MIPRRALSEEDLVKWVKAGWTLEQRFISCGKSSCRCQSGKGHGPYWYAFRRRPDARLTTCYIGKVAKGSQKSSSTGS